ncbi:hypothetical protein [Amycolatopsis sp. NPDC051371]|uniref:hypothetical protein n=1 Tax=Amycolatopsis sp. NPDC051371 TaxID=3155800 RepID=UPI003427F58E
MEKVCFVGLDGEVQFEVPAFHRRQVMLPMSRSMSIVQQRLCAAFIARNRLPVDELYSHQWRLDEVVEAYRGARPAVGGQRSHRGRRRVLTVSPQGVKYVNVRQFAQ